MKMGIAKLLSVSVTINAMLEQYHAHALKINGWQSVSRVADLVRWPKKTIKKKTVRQRMIDDMKKTNGIYEMIQGK